jgi:hypothetical protein
LAYVSNETGRDEVYIASFPSQESKWQISVDGGTAPEWRRDGRELFYMSPIQTLMTVNIGSSGPALNVSAPHELFRMPAGSSYQSLDGQRFLLSSSEVETTAAPISIVVNWQAELRRDEK